MTDDGGCVVLIFFNKLFSSGECDLVDVFVDLFGCHTDTAIGYLDRIVVEADMDRQVTQFTLKLAD